LGLDEFLYSRLRDQLVVVGLHLHDEVDALAVEGVNEDSPDHLHLTVPFDVLRRCSRLILG
jgi:hypothetical protein